MAENETNDIKDDDLELGDAPPAKKGGLLKKILNKQVMIMAVALIAVVAISVGTTMMLTGSKSDSSEEDAEEMAAEESPDKEEKKKKKTKKKKGTKGESTYFNMEPAFVVNFADKTGLRYLQITMEVLVSDPLVIEEIKKHAPIIRNNIVLLLSSMTYDVISTREGKQKIRTDVLKEIQKVLQEKIGEPGVEAVYFTSFVVQ